ncbi:hypothetical protein [Methanopyrus kandleri]|uniref:hypothetical protein n=1 Tax=Methanopyrus kandleri TaxID=2320 RepID=UPI0011E4EE38|nr:hypothetical protein [Methanopyrus kandleri]
MVGEVEAPALPAVLLTALVLPIPATGMPLKLPVILKEVYRFPEWEDATTALVPVLGGHGGG